MMLAAYCAVLLLVFLFQSRLLFLPDLAGRELAATPADIGLVHHDVSIRTSDGQTLHAWWLPHPQPRAFLLFSHGNAGNISHRLESLEIFYNLGLSVLIYDYRGYGQSTGSPSETGLYADGESVLRWLLDRADIDASDVLVFGRSMGGAVAASLAARHEVGALILESSFTSVPELAQELYWWLPARWLARIRFPTREFLANGDQPTLIVHSRNDEIVPFSHGRALYETAPHPKQFLELDGSHNTGFLDSSDAYIAGLDSFLTEVLNR
jgi:fermentation-respiration switch protein FrsA (DUF1100 family)